MAREATNIKVSSMELNGSKLFEVKKDKNELILGKEAPPIGLEPMTDWLTASRST